MSIQQYRLHGKVLALLGTRQDFIEVGICFHAPTPNADAEWGVLEMDFPLREEDIEFYDTKKEAKDAAWAVVKNFEAEVKRWS